MVQLLWPANLRREARSFHYLIPLPQPAKKKSQKLICHSARIPILVVNPRQVSAVSPEVGILWCSCCKGDGNSCCWCPGAFKHGGRECCGQVGQKAELKWDAESLNPAQEWISFSICIWAGRLHRYFWCEFVWVNLNYWGCCGWKPQNQPTNQTRLQ